MLTCLNRSCPSSAPRKHALTVVTGTTSAGEEHRVESGELVRPGNAEPAEGERMREGDEGDHPDGARQRGQVAGRPQQGQVLGSPGAGEVLGRELR